MDVKTLDTLSVKGELQLIFTNVKTGKVRVYSYKNMVVTRGKNAIAQRLMGNSSAGEITYLATGTNTTAPALVDTQLGTELFRKLISVREVNGNSAVLRTFFTISESNGTLREMGLFGNADGVTASGTANSGQLYCRAACNQTKTSSDTLTVQWTITVG